MPDMDLVSFKEMADAVESCIAAAPNVFWLADCDTGHVLQEIVGAHRPERADREGILRRGAKDSEGKTTVRFHCPAHIEKCGSRIAEKHDAQAGEREVEAPFVEGVAGNISQHRLGFAHPGVGNPLAELCNRMLRNVGSQVVAVWSYTRRQFKDRGAAAAPDVKDVLSRMWGGDLEYGLGYAVEQFIDRFVMVRPDVGRRAVPEFRLRSVAGTGVRVRHNFPSFPDPAVVTGRR